MIGMDNEKFQELVLKQLESLSLGQAKLEDGQNRIEKKLDAVYEQVAHNTEQEIRLDTVTENVSQLDTDLKLIKKIVANQ